MPPLKLGMLGMWHTHADGVVNQIAQHADEFSLTAFYDPDPQVVRERRDRWGRRLGELRVFERPEQVLAEPLDGVIVEGRVHENLAMARLALESGRPVMLEKPAGTDLAEFRRLIELAEHKNLHVQMIYLFRYMAAVVEMLRLAREGELGRVYAFRARLPKQLDDYDRFVEELAPYTGGMYFEMAGHVIDMMVAVLGAPRRTKALLAHHHEQPPASYMDNAMAIFECESALGVIEIPALEVAPHSRRLEVYGTRGACAIPHLGSGHLANKNIQPIEIYRQGESDWSRLDLPAETLHIRDLREFAAVISGAKEPDYGMRHDLAVQTALLESAGMA